MGGAYVLRMPSFALQSSQYHVSGSGGLRSTHERWNCIENPCQQRRNAAKREERGSSHSATRKKECLFALTHWYLQFSLSQATICT